MCHLGGGPEASGVAVAWSLQDPSLSRWRLGDVSPSVPPVPRCISLCLGQESQTQRASVSPLRPRLQGRPRSAQSRCCHVSGPWGLLWLSPQTRLWALGDFLLTDIFFPR